ncbi:MAG: glycoside hydrolase family 66 protein [Sporolactobacillus sp.]|jgi:dextranase|nr:glycoside hydrolase family 66 protein [Sporolactobacillus sp.]
MKNVYWKEVLSLSNMISYFDAYPDQAQYRPNNQGHIVVEIAGNIDVTLTLKVRFMELEKLIYHCQTDIDLKKEIQNRLLIPFRTENRKWQCIGVDMSLYNHNQLILTKSTAYDVADHWGLAPRYGFLSDFQSEESEKLDDILFLNKFHINLVQFYDWMYRHDDLIPHKNHFKDPMGRALSYEVITEKRKAAQKRGMAAIAYGAVYAALKDYYQSHKQQALYKRNGEPFNLIDRFFIMDVSPDSQWTAKIISEFVKVIQEGFDGIHLDQYGFPKKALRHPFNENKVVDLSTCYPKLINKLREKLNHINDRAVLIFNNVSNYPVWETAKAKQDVVYIEVWPPVKHYYELKQLIDRGRSLSGKQVVLAAYLPLFKNKLDYIKAENDALITMATIFASGGYHLLLGEHNCVLATAYYPDHVKMRDSFAKEVRHYYDFIVRYGNLLYSFDLHDVSMTYTGGINTEVQFQGKSEVSPNGDCNTVWSLIKNSSHYMVIHLVNLVGIENDLWGIGKKARPTVENNIICSVLMEHQVESLISASPDQLAGRPVPLKYEIVDHKQGRAIRFVVPLLKIWDMIVIKWRN